MTRIKICGLTEIPHAVTAAKGGADFIGMVFVPGWHQVSTEKALRLTEAVRCLESGAAMVGIFVNTAVNEVNRIADYCHLDWIQLSGDETWHYCQEIERPIIKAIHVSTYTTAEHYLDEIAAGYQLLPHQKLVCLLDTKVAGTYGGTGQTFDWLLAKEISAKFPVIIAGGLIPDNVGELVEKVKPWGVDVSTGVETSGKKDEARILAFIKAVKKAEDGERLKVKGNTRIAE